MRFFDCNCALGMPGPRGLRYARTLSELREEIEFCGIDRALVYHTAQRFDSPILGNPLLLQDLEADPAFAPVWTILPSQTCELASPNDFVSQMKAQGVRAVRVFPDEHRYAFNALTLGDWLAILEERRIPLLAKTSVLKMADVLQSFPNLVIVAMEQGPHSLDRYLRPVVERYPNFYIDTSSYISDGLIEEFCKRYGPGRLLFGSGYPDDCSGAALLRLAQAEISADYKQAIAAGNLERILGEAQL
jgi:uncharacterized protein